VHRRTALPVLAIALVAALALPLQQPLPAHAADPAAAEAFRLEATVRDAAVALSGPTEPIAVPETASVTGELVLDAESGSLEATRLALEAVDGPGSASLTVGETVLAAAGETAPVEPGETRVTAEFGAPGVYTVTLGASGTVVRAATEEAPEERRPLASEPIALVFEVAGPVAEEAPTAEHDADSPDASDVAGGAGASAPLGAPGFGTLGTEAGTRPIALTSGHIDLFEVTYDAALGGLRLSVKDDTKLYDSAVQYRDPTGVAVYVDEALAAADVTGVAGSPLDFLTVGGTVSTIYLLPQTQNMQLPWPGWSTERLAGTLPEGIALSGDPDLPIHLDLAIEGPGEVFTWQSGSFGAVINTYVDTVDPAADVIPIGVNKHVHTNWAFTAPGDYDVTATPTATTTAGDTISGPSVVYRFRIGPAAAAAPEAIAPPTVVGTGAVGEPLTAAQGEWLPQPQAASYRWLREGVAIEGATAATYTPVAADLGRFVSVEVTARVGAAATTATAPPVEIVAGGAPVDLAPTTVTLATNAAGTQTSTTVSYGGAASLTATVTPNGPSGAGTPVLGVGGIVEIWHGDERVGEATITNPRTGRVTVAVTPTALGANDYRARYVPPSTHAVSVSDPVTVTVEPRATSVAVAAGLAEAAVGQPVELAVAVTPASAAGHVQLRDGGTVVAEGDVSGGRYQTTIADLPLGAHALSAVFTSAAPEYADAVSSGAGASVTIVEGAPRGDWGRTVVDHEHVDAFSARLVDGALVLGTRADLDAASKTPSATFTGRDQLDPAQTVFHLPDRVSTGLGTPGGRKTVPDNPAFGFLGAPGDTVWVAPQSNDSTPFLYAGFEAESIDRGALRDDVVVLHLLGVDGPDGGRFEAYSGALRATGEPWRILSSVDDLAADPAGYWSGFDGAPFEVGSHEHFQWAFTKPGTYVLHVRAAATLADGTPVESEVVDYTWVVGDLAPAPEVTVDEHAGTEGETALTATVAPAAEGHVEFREADGTLLGVAPTADGVAVLPIALAAGRHTVTAEFLPAVLDRSAAAASEPTEVRVVAPPLPTRPIALTKGHIDLFEVTYDAGLEGLRMRVKDDTRLYGEETRYLDPADVTVYLDSALAEQPAPYLGLDSAYQLPQTQDMEQPWPGWSTERLVASLPEGVTASTALDAVRLELSIDGPGDVIAWQWGVFGDVINRYVDTTDATPDVIPVTRNAHVHTNWAFTELGDYRITVSPSLATADGGTITGPPAVYRIHVGPASDAAPVSVAAPSIAGAGTVGEPLILNAGEWLPRPHATTVEWLRDGEPIAGAAGTEYTPVESDADHAIAARVTATVGGASSTVDSAALPVSGAGEGEEGPVVLGAGVVTVTPGFTAVDGAPGRIATAPLGLLDQTRASADDPWYAPEDAVIHLGDDAFDSATSTWKTAPDAAGATVRPLFGFEAAVHGVSGGTLLRGDYDQLNRAFFDDLFAAGVPQVELVNASGPSGGIVTATVGVRGLWDSEALLSGVEQTKRNVQIGNQLLPVLAFDEPGQYCLTFRETIPTNSAGTLITMATYTFYVGDLPGILAPCEQAGPYGVGGDEEVTVYDRGHTDLRVGFRDGALVFGMGSSLVPLSAAVLGRTPPPQTVPERTMASDYGAIGEPGTEYWYFPASSSPEGYLWPGFSSESVAPGDIRTPLTFTLRGYSVDGVPQPDGSSIVLQDGFSGNPLTRAYFDTSRGRTAFQLDANVHSHPVWAFTQPGVYCVNLSVSAVLRDGVRGTADGLLTFVVGDDASARISEIEPCERRYPDHASWPMLEPSGAGSPVSEGVRVAELSDWNAVLARLERVAGEPELLAQVSESGVAEPSPRRLEDVVLSSRHQRAGGEYEVAPSVLQISTESFDAANGVEWLLGEIAGPGELTLSVQSRASEAVLGSASPGASYPLAVPDRTTNIVWRFSAPGVYCVPTTFTDDEVSTTAVLTFAIGIDSEGLTTCSRGQLPSEPDGGTETPVDEPWNVPNWTSTESGATILNLGHIDVASVLDGAVLDTLVKDTTDEGVAHQTHDGASWHDPQDVVLQLLPDSQMTVPASAAYAFLGAPGSKVWQVAETQQPGLLWPGWSTESIPEAATQTGVQWRLTDMTGPGEFALYTSDPLRPGGVIVRYSTRDGITPADSFEIAKHAHVHGSWAFSAEGTYCLAFERSTVLADGTPASDEFALAVAVGEVDVRSVDPADCFTAPTGEPAEADTTPVDDADLTEEAAGEVQALNGANGFTPGQLVTVQVGAARAGDWVSVWMHSDPKWWLGWALVGDTGAVQVRLPADIGGRYGGHRIVVKDRDGALVGWDAISVVAPPPPPPQGGGGPAPQDPSYPDAQCVAGSTILSSGHIDYASRIVGGKLESLVGDDTGGSKVYREPSSVVLWLKPSSEGVLGGSVPQVGPAGARVWQVPQSQNPNLIWLGWSTEALNAGNTSGPVSWTLNGVDGPGSVTVWTQSSFGGVQQLVFAGPGSTSVPLGTHAHAYWTFTAEGIYRLSFTQTATLVGGGTSSDTETLTIVVGDIDPASAAGGSGCGAISNVILGSDDADAAKQAAAQAQAAAALAARGALPGGGRGPGSDAGLVDPITALNQGNPVPLLLGVLGGVLLLGAAGTGVLWWRRRPSA